MHKKSDGQGELILENRQLLLIFFGIVALCGIFFSLGYIVGRNTLRPTAPVTQAEPGVAEPGNKPSAMPPATYLNPSPNATANTPESSSSGTDLNFYQSTEEKTPEAKLVAPESSPPASREPSHSPEPQKLPAAEPTPPGILIQVSALTRREDADSLASLLKEKHLPVLVISGTSDSLFHVVVGPYKNEKEAQGAKKVLEEEGFRPIIKH